MPQQPQTRGAWGTIAVVLLIGVFLVRYGTEDRAGPPQPTSATSATPATSGLAPHPPPSLPYSAPVRVVIPSIGVDAPFTGVDLTSDGWIDTPPAAHRDVAGWFTGAASPGEQGTSVVVGHVDNANGPAVFYRLGSLRKGARIEVARQDGRTAAFSVYAVEVVAKKDFPADRVYRTRGRPELRVITCGGGFSGKTGYAGNVVAFARLTEVR
ncbi:class F sortase [Streptomyces sp. A3M-1-3]|uniref:class F sortase n=1 Tax=Streptomyces sp. A3M-1-3 TaxID=2962044 RepID=UPI0020B65D83|nr:class F sortase [Streptomyces sp. A3M-1-3]MCP3818859.1 class F sortase [Streptomyces sp. A3M-1-3]